MSQQTPNKRVLFVRRSVPALLVLFGVFSLLLINLRSPHLAQAATSNTINFQARLETSSGAIAPDGNYNVEFKLYSASSGGTALWTEDYTYNSGSGSTDARVRVANGYLSVSLGSITPFPNTIDWTQQQWITMNIGGTVSSGTITWDGEMSPRLQLTAVPYAFASGQLQTTSGSITSTLSIQAPTGGNQTFVIQNQGAAGTYNLLTQNQGNANYIQNQSASPQTANFDIQSASASTVGGIIQGASGQTADFLEFKDSSGTVLSKVDNIGDGYFGGTVTSVRIGSFADPNNAYIQAKGSTANIALVLQAQGTSATTIQSGSGSPLAIFGVDGTTTLNSQSVSATPLVIKGYSGQTGNLLQVEDVNGNILTKADSNGQLTSYGTNTNLLGLAVPTVSSVTTSTTGGTLVAGTYYYVVTATNAQGETIASTSGNVTTTGSTSSNTINWGSIAGATGYKLYRNTSNSFTSGSLLLTTITNGVTVSYVDTGSATGVGLPPTAPTGTGLIVGSWANQTAPAFQIQNSTGSALLTADTSGMNITIAGNVVVGAGKSITITGGNTASRPASPTEGMLYYDTSTHSLLVYSNGKWQADRSTATKIVGMGTTSGCTGSVPVASANPDAADYVVTSCTSAQTTINSAIAALPAGGGTVYLMEGTYIVDGPIDLKQNVNIGGSGATTILKLKNSTNTTMSVIDNANITALGNITISNLLIDGNKANNTTGTEYGIGFTAATNSVALTISGVTVQNALSGGLYAHYGFSSSFVTGSTFKSNGGYGMWFGSSNNTISDNTITNNTSDGMYLSGAYYSKIDDNYIAGNGGWGINTSVPQYSTYSSNTLYNNTSGGMKLYGSNSSTASGNNILSNGGPGIDVQQSNSLSITGNYIGSNATQGIFYTINNLSDNLISGNTLVSNGGSGTYNSIDVSGSYTNLRILDNTITTSATGYGIYTDSFYGPTGVYISGNTYSGPGTALRPGIKGTVYANQSDGNGNIINSGQGAFTVGTSTVSSTLSIQGGVTATALSAPAAPTLATVGTAGTTSYTYAVTALDGTGETLPSTTTTITTGNATLSGTNYIKVTFSPVSGATSYKVYRTASGGSPATTGYIGTVTSTGATSYTFNDTGLAASGSTPASNTTGGGTFAGTLQGASGTLTSGTLTLGTASTSTGGIKFYSASGSGSVTLTLTNPGTTNYTLSIPTLTGNDTICTVGAANCTGGSGSGVTSIGTYNSQTANANGAVISGTTLFLQSASGSTPGLIDGNNQSFAGNKTFTGSVLASTFDTASATALNIGTTSATNVYIGNASGGINLNGNTTNVNNANFVVGGTSSAVAKVSISGTVSSTSTNLQYGVNNQVNFNPQGASISVIYALNNIATISGSSLNIPTFIGTNTSVATASGFTGTVADARGLNIGGPTIGGSSLFTTYTGINISGNSANGGNTTGTITNTQLNISGTTAGAGTGGTVNNYGINITQPAGTGGTTNNYGLYIQGNGAGSINYSIYNASTALSYFAGGITSAGTLQGGTVNATSGYQFNGTNGSTTTCSGGQFLQNQVVQGGIVTGGTCAAAGTIGGSGTANTIAMFTAGGTIGNSILSQSGTTVSVGGALTATGAITGASINTSGYYYQNGQIVVNTTTGSGANTFIGAGAANNTATGGDNTAIGSNSLQALTSGGNNTALGFAAGGSINTGSGNTSIGTYSGLYDALGTFDTLSGLQNATAIGAYAQVQASNSIVLGSVDNPTKVGIGITVPSNIFSVSPLDYQTGTATRTNASATLTGTGTTWTSAMVGDIIVFADGTTNTVASFTSATSITMGTTYTGTTDASPVNYRFHKPGFQVTSAGNAYVQNTSTTAFQVQNASGANVFGVNTSANQVLFGKASTVNASLVLYNSTNANTVTLQSGATSGSYTITLPTAIGTAGQCLAVSSVAGSTANLGFSSCGGGGSGHAKKIVLTPEYAGAVLDGSSDTGCTATNGTMTSGFDTGLTGFGNTTQSYYKWQNGVTGNQCYDIVVQVPVPSDFSSWASTTPITINTNTTDTTNGLINLDARDTSGTAESGCSYVSVTPASTNTWTTLGSNCTLAGTYAAGGYMTLRVRVTAPNGGSVKVGNVVLNYNSSY